MSRFLWKVENKKLALLWKWTWTLIKYLWTNCFHFDIKWKHFHPIGKNIQHTSCIPRKTLYKTFFVLIHERACKLFFSVLWSFMPTWQSKVFSYLSISNNAWLIFWIFSAYIFFSFSHWYSIQGTKFVGVIQYQLNRLHSKYIPLGV